jgi:hypothetical protein
MNERRKLKESQGVERMRRGRTGGENHGNVEIREREQRDERAANVQGRAMQIGEIAEPPTDDEASDQLM